MKRFGLTGNIMLGFALAALGCAGSRGYQRSGLARAPQSAYATQSPAEVPAASPPQYSPSPVAPPQQPGIPSEPTPAPNPTPVPGEIPPPPSFERETLLTPPAIEREPLSAQATGLRRLRVPLNLQPIGWKNWNQRNQQSVPVQPPAVLDDAYTGHSLSPSRRP